MLLNIYVSCFLAAINCSSSTILPHFLKLKHNTENCSLSCHKEFKKHNNCPVDINRSQTRGSWNSKHKKNATQSWAVGNWHLKWTLLIDPRCPSSPMISISTTACRQGRWGCYCTMVFSGPNAWESEQARSGPYGRCCKILITKRC